MIDPLTIDGGGLDSTHDTYPSNSECRCANESVCDTVTNRMAGHPLPSGEELMVMLADALGYQVIVSDGS